MKAFRIIAVTIAATTVVAAIAVFVAAHHRDSIARQIAASLLAPYGVEVEKVSVASIGTDRVDFDVVVLRHDEGTGIRLEAISLPVSTRGLAGLEIAIGRVEIAAPAAGQDDDFERADIAGIVDRLIELPDTLPGTSVVLSSLAIPGYPEIANIGWRSDAGGQSLTAEIGTYALNAAIDPADTGPPTARLRLAAGTRAVGTRDAFEAALLVTRGSDGYSLAGPFTLAVPPLIPAFVRQGLLPEPVGQLDAELDGEVTIGVPEDTSEAIRISATTSPRGTPDLSYRAADGTVTRVRILEASVTEAQLEYPSLAWQATTSDARLRLGYGALEDLSLRLRQVVCTDGIRCTLGVILDRADIGADIGLSANAARVALSAAGDDWRVHVDEVSLDVDGITGPADLAAALSVRLGPVTIEDGGSTILSGLSVSAADVRLLGHELVVPAIGGRLVRSGNDLTLALEARSNDDAFRATATLAHDLAAAETLILLDEARLDFSRRALSGFVERWPYDWDVVAGTWTANAEISRRGDGHGNDDSDLRFTAAQALEALAGRYRDVAFTGLATELSMTHESWPPKRTLPVSLSLDLLDVGFAIEDLEADLSVDAGAGRIAVDRAEMETLGGRVSVDPFVFDPAAESRHVVLRPESIQLQLMTDLANLQALEVSGSVSGVVPVTIGPDGVTIDGGRLTGDPPGGAIRHRVAGCTEEIMRARSGLDYARCVLTDYEFDSLTSELSYGQDGNLVLEMRLTGVNPQYDPEQPVNLNPKLETKLVDLIKSLQAARSIEEVFNRQLGR